MKSATYGPSVNELGAKLHLAPVTNTTFDSSIGLLRAFARFLKGRDFPTLGLASAFQPMAALMNAALSQHTRE